MNHLEDVWGNDGVELLPEQSVIVPQTTQTTTATAHSKTRPSKFQLESSSDEESDESVEKSIRKTTRTTSRTRRTVNLPPLPYPVAPRFRLSQRNGRPLPRYKLLVYPGLVRNVDLALERMSGLGNIQMQLKVFKENIKYGRPTQVRLKYHPNATPAEGLLANVQKLLLRVRRYKDKTEYRFIGIIDNELTFESHADFQYVVPKQTQYLLNVQDRLETVPRLFANTDRNLKYRFKDFGLIRSRSSQNEFITFEDPIPTSPTRQKPDQFSSDEKDSFERLEYLFKQRPIWSRKALEHVLPYDYSFGTKFGPPSIRRFLPMIGYKFKNGPWMNCWVRYGYDPRKERKAIIYQLISWRTPVLFHKYTSRAANSKKNRMIARTRLLKTGEKRHFVQDISEDNTSEEAHIFRYRCPSRQRGYQLCDIYMNNVVHYLKQAMEKDPDFVPTAENGHFLDNSWKKNILDMMKDQMEHWVKEQEGFPQGKSASDNILESDPWKHDIEPFDLEAYKRRKNIIIDNLTSIGEDMMEDED